MAKLKQPNRFRRNDFMKNNLLKFIAVTILSLILPAISFAEVSQAVFASNPQSIKPNEVSAPITVQTQNSSGEGEALGETSDVFLTTTSATGEFSSSADNWQNVDKVTMNSNWANRTFYYKDSSEGAFSISVRIVGRNTGKEFTAGQEIAISSGASQSASETQNSNSQSYSSSGSGSNLSSQTVTRTQTPGLQLELASIPDRTASPGSPLFFQAVIKKNTTQNERLTFSWSFGDGSVGEGQLVNHTYKYPGEYALVLSAKAGDNFSVSRAKIKVLETKISVASGDGYIEISNNSDSEINLFNWKIIGGGKGFIFQPDTIIFPRSKMKVDKSLLTIKGEIDDGIVLKNYFGEIVAVASEPMPREELEKLAKETKSMQEKAMAIVDQALAKGLVTEISPKPTNFEQAKNSEVAGAFDFAKVATTSSSDQNIIYQAEEEENIFSKAWHFLISMLH